VTIGTGLSTINGRAFSECGSLTSATFSGNAPGTVGTNIFSNTASGFTIYFYQGKTGWTTPTWNGYKTVMLGSQSTTVTITWNYSGGSGSPTSSSLTPGSAFGTLPVPNPRTGYTFSGWFTDSTGGIQITSSSNVPNTNTTYYARWMLIPKTITLTSSNPTVAINVESGITGRVPITVTAPSTGSVLVHASNRTSGSDYPKFYDSSGNVMASIYNESIQEMVNEKLNGYWLYVVPAEHTAIIYAGTQYNGATSYTVTATFTSAKAVVLTPLNPAATVFVTPSGNPSRVPITITAPSSGNVSVRISKVFFAVDPVLYDSSNGIIADDNSNSQFIVNAGQTVTIYAGARFISSYTVTATFPSANATTLGDVNMDSDIDIGDVNIVYQHVRGKRQLSSNELLAANVNKDGDVDIGDVNRIYLFVRGKISAF